VKKQLIEFNQAEGVIREKVRLRKNVPSSTTKRVLIGVALCHLLM